jgi:hypothetical protein
MPIFFQSSKVYLNRFWFELCNIQFKFLNRQAENDRELVW